VIDFSFFQKSIISIEFEHNLENEVINHSHQLPMQKIAMTSYKNASHSYPSTSSINKQQDINNTYDENKPIKTFLWSKSTSKDGLHFARSDKVDLNMLLLLLID
jgi:hypothetical protein